MKKLFLLLIVFPTIVNAQSISLDSLHQEFERYLTGPKQPDVQIGGKTYQTVGLRFEATQGSLLANFANDNSRLLDYLGTNFLALKDEYLYSHDSDSSRFNVWKILPDSIWRNLYFERLSQILVRYLQAKEHLSVDGIILNNRPFIRFAYLQDYAAKFYYPDSIQPDGGIRTHICVGFNGYRDAAPPRNLMLEAIAYSVVNEHVMIPNDPIMEELDNAIKAAESLNLSDDYDVKLQRAQGVVWGLMSQDAFLEKAIRDMYAEKKDWLTFELH